MLVTLTGRDPLKDLDLFEAPIDGLRKAEFVRGHRQFTQRRGGGMRGFYMGVNLCYNIYGHIKSQRGF